MYKRHANSFWLDVPHHRAKMKRKTNPKRKLKMQISKKESTTDYSFLKFKKEQRKRKKGKILAKNQNNSADNLSSLTLVRDFS